MNLAEHGAERSVQGALSGAGSGAGSGADSETDLHIFAAIVENKFGVLARIAGLFSRRGFNIYSLAVAPTDDPAYSRITIVVDVRDTNVDQIRKQLDKLINVVHISELHSSESVERELLLARVDCTDRAGLDALLDTWGAVPLEERDGELILSKASHPDDIDRFEAALAPFGIRVLQRTGRIALRSLSADAPAVGISS